MDQLDTARGEARRIIGGEPSGEEGGGRVGGRGGARLLSHSSSASSAAGSTIETGGGGAAAGVGVALFEVRVSTFGGSSANAEFQLLSLAWRRGSRLVTTLSSSKSESSERHSLSPLRIASSVPATHAS